MTNILKILLLEDNPADAELVEYELKKAKLNYSLKKTDTTEGFVDSLMYFKPDIILSDYSLPQINGLQALELARYTCIETPFILVTGNLNEETAVTCIKLGAWDYILKDKLVRLVPAINNALKLKEEIEEKNRALENLKKSEAKYLDLYNNAPDMFLSVDSKTAIIIDCNQTLLNEMGYTREEFVGKEIYEFYTHGTVQYSKEILFPFFNKTGYLKGAELEVIKKDGSIIDVSLTNSAVYNDEGQIIHSRSIWRDITEKRKTEQSLKASEEKYRVMLEAYQDIVIIKLPNNSISYMNPAAKLKSVNKKFNDKCYEALFGFSHPCIDCKVSKGEKVITHHREIIDPTDNSVYLASYFPIKNTDGSEALMCIYKDITSFRNIEKERISLLNILEATQNEIYIIDQKNNQIKYVNESAVHNTRYSKEELLKMSVFDLIINYSNHTLEEITNSIDRKEYRKIVFEANIKRSDGSIYPVEIHMQLIDQHEVKLLLAIIIDISERQKKDELIVKLSKGIEQSPVTVLITDLDGNIEFINPKFTETTGYSFEEIKGKNPSILKSGRTTDLEYKDLWKTIKNGGIWHGDFLNKKKNGEFFWENAIISPIKDKNNNITHFIGLKQDISNHKKIEEELKQEKLLLSKRVDERTSDLSQLNAELSKAVRMKDEFLANMSHELRTPLNAILGLSEVMQEEVYGPLNQAQLKSLKTIEDSGRHLLALINDILDIAKVGAGKVELEIYQVSILSICQTCLNFVKQTALKKDIKYSLKIETITEIVMADERRLKQILINLLSNAVKFTPEGGSIGLVVQEDLMAESIIFTVWDKGIGISSESLAKLFQPFIQIDSSLSREYAGTGLGLTLVKSLTELHGGCVTVESTPGQGSSFSISLPKTTFTIFDEELKKRNIIHASQIKHLPLNGKVLIIEDSIKELQKLKLFVNQMGLEYTIKQNDVNLIENIELSKPDLIIFDIDLVGISGWQMLDLLRSNNKLSEIPLIVISKKEDSEIVIKKGINECIIKPLTKENIELAVKKYIRIIPKQHLENNQEEKALILIAEDNENNIQMLIDYLQNLNYRILVARNGNEAISLAQERIPDVILMDIQMPGLDGIEASKIIRKSKNKKIAKIPIIALTALAMPGDMQKCFDAGMNEYIKKPLSLKSLVISIEEILKIK